MRVKLDENIGSRGREVLLHAGWEVDTVVEEGLCGATDQELIDVCRESKRVLVSLDKDFADVFWYPPPEYMSIVVIRLPEPITLRAIENALRRLVLAAGGQDLKGKLWIVDTRRIREFEPS